MMSAKVSIATLLIYGLFFCLDGWAAVQDNGAQNYGLTNADNLIKNGSFEDGNRNWSTPITKSSNDIISYNESKTPHIVNVPYWEGKAAFYQPVHGRRYLEIKWSNAVNTASQSKVTQEVTAPSPGKYLLIAHVTAHMGEAADSLVDAIPNASVIISDAASGSIIRKVSIDWLPARQEWILVGAVVDIKRKIKLSLGFDVGGAVSANHSGKPIKNFAYLFDDIRLIAVDDSPVGLTDRFEENSKLNLSLTGVDTRPLYEHEYMPGNFTSRQITSTKKVLAFTPDSGWQFNAPQSARMFTNKQENGKNIIVARVTKAQIKDAIEAAQEVQLPSHSKDKRNVFSASTWVWSDTPRSAYLRLDYDSDKNADSAFHTGSGKWEYLTVVAPYPIEGDLLKIALRANAGEVKFQAPDLLVMSDDRFGSILPPQDIGGGRLRERVSFQKDLSRIRIVVVGNSTVNGVAFVAHHATFPYLLQLKLETLYPGKFEVINYGIGAGGLLDQIVSVKHHFKFATNDTNYYLKLINPARYETPNSLSLADASLDAISLATLKPDIIIISSMWNDLDRLFNWEVLERDYGSLTELLTLLDNPSPASFEAYQTKKTSVLGMIKKRQTTLAPKNHSYAWSTDQNYEDLSNDAQFFASSRWAEDKYSELLEAFVSRASGISTIWNLNLPANGGKKAVDYFDRFPDLMLKADSLEKEKRKAIVFYRQFSGDIQSRVGNNIALKHHIPSLDLVHSYNAIIQDADSGEWAKLDYFVPDLIHFTYRGNEWIADEIFRIMGVEFEQMAKKNH